MRTLTSRGLLSCALAASPLRLMHPASEPSQQRLEQQVRAAKAAAADAANAEARLRSMVSAANQHAERMFAEKQEAEAEAARLRLELAALAARREPPALAALETLDAPDRPDLQEVLRRVSPSTLAYLGDSVFDAALRERFLWPPSRVRALAARVRALTRAEGQSELMRRLSESGWLRPVETDWARRGRNGSGRGPRRVPGEVYASATAFEALVGCLHLADRSRLVELMDWVVAQDLEHDVDHLDP